MMMVDCLNCGGRGWHPFSGTYDDCPTCSGRGVIDAEPAATTERSIVAHALLAARRLGWRWHDAWDQGQGWRQIELRPPGSAAGFHSQTEVWRFEAPGKGSR